MFQTRPANLGCSFGLGRWRRMEYLLITTCCSRECDTDRDYLGRELSGSDLSELDQCACLIEWQQDVGAIHSDSRLIRETTMYGSNGGTKPSFLSIYLSSKLITSTGALIFQYPRKLDYGYRRYFLVLTKLLGLILMHLWSSLCKNFGRVRWRSVALQPGMTMFCMWMW